MKRKKCLLAEGVLRMKCFKIDNKSYYVEFKNASCTITEFGNKDYSYVFTLSELKELSVEISNVNAFTERGVAKDFITGCTVSNLTEDGVCIKVQTQYERAGSFFQVPLEDFCKDITVIYKANEGKNIAIGDKMPSVKEAFEKWKKKSSFLFLEGQFLLVNHLDENIGAGVFDGDATIAALSKTNLALFEEIKLYFLDGNYANISLKMKKKLNSTTSYYTVKLKSLPPFKTPEKLKLSIKKALQALENIDLKNKEEADMILKALDIKEVGKAKSVLDDFISL